MDGRLNDSRLKQGRGREYLKEGSECVAVFFFPFFPCGEFVRDDRKRRMNFNAVEMEVLVGEVNTRSVKQRNERNNR